MKEYKVYRCCICNTIFIIPAEYIKTTGRYLACPYGHRKIKTSGAYDSLKECMDSHVYVRESGRMRQIK